MTTVWGTPIGAGVEQVIQELKMESPIQGLFRDIRESGENLMVTCPFHGGGRERKPSCGILLREKTGGIKPYEAGTVHCYSCGYASDLPGLVADILGLSSPLEGFRWIIGRFGFQSGKRADFSLDLYRGSASKPAVFDAGVVEGYRQALLESTEARAYLERRCIPERLYRPYGLGYDRQERAVLFPVRGMDGEVAFYKGRSISGKRFMNSAGADKGGCVYGLWELALGPAQPAEWVWLAESEIDALALAGQGVPAVALMGSHISEGQCRVLERCRFRRFVLALDNDTAGRKGAAQVKDVLIPKGFRFKNLKWKADVKDVDELIQEYGRAWLEYLEAS